MTQASTSFAIRPITDEDESNLLNLYRRCEDFLAFGPEPHASMEMVRNDRERSAEQDGIFYGIFKNREELVGVIDFIPFGYKEKLNTAYIGLLIITPEERRKGLGSMIVNRLVEDLLHNRMVELVMAHVQVNTPDAQLFWESLGFKVCGPEAAQPDGTVTLPLRKFLQRNDNFTIAQERPEWIQMIWEVNAGAFKRPGEADLVDDLREKGKHLVSLAALDGDNVVGHVLFSPMTFDPPCDTVRAAGMGPVAVLAGWRRQGVAARLIKAGLEECRKLGIDLVFVEGNPAYYHRFGFSTAADKGINCKYDVAAKYFMALELTPDSAQKCPGIALYDPAFDLV